MFELWPNILLRENSVHELKNSHKTLIQFKTNIKF
jgi:hypothetical protein